MSACPFKVGDRVVNDLSTDDPATVTELTERGGFKYKYDEPQAWIPRWGMQITGGECFGEGMEFWRLAAPPEGFQNGDGI